MPVIEMVCLANSKKHGGRCVAGLRTDGQGWIRPVSLKPEGTLFERNYTLSDGSPAGLLDLLQIQFALECPEPHHPENRVITHSQWELCARPAPLSLAPLLRHSLVSGPELLGNTQNRIPFTAFEKTPAASSLALVLPESLQWEIGCKESGERRTHLLFQLRGTAYRLPLTDPAWERRLAVLSPGTYLSERVGIREADVVLLTISLSEPFAAQEGGERHCYKLCAAVVVLPPSWNSVFFSTSAPAQAEPEGYDWSWLEGSTTGQAVVRAASPVRAIASQTASPSRSTNVERPSTEKKAEYQARIEQVQQTNPRAYADWSEAEDAWLTKLVKAGHTEAQIATLLQRQISAVRSRIQKLDLMAGRRGVKEGTE